MCFLEYFSIPVEKFVPRGDSSLGNLPQGNNSYVHICSFSRKRMFTRLNPAPKSLGSWPPSNLLAGFEAFSDPFLFLSVLLGVEFQAGTVPSFPIDLIFGFSLRWIWPQDVPYKLLCWCDQHGPAQVCEFRNWACPLNCSIPRRQVCRECSLAPFVLTWVCLDTHEHITCLVCSASYFPLSEKPRTEHPLFKGRVLVVFCFVLQTQG